MNAGSQSRSARSKSTNPGSSGNENIRSLPLGRFSKCRAFMPALYAAAAAKGKIIQLEFP